jgi:phenylacetate-coenzyme A ligase PaaK-like adenylate-forming protein
MVTAPVHPDPLARARQAFVDRLPSHFQRLAWTPDQVAAHQTAALRQLLRVAIERSPFHRRRLGPVVGAIDTFELRDLPRLPVMTKADMMACYSDVVTDRRLTRATVEAHVSEIGTTPKLLLGEYVVLASGGSSGVRGVFAWPTDLIADYLATILRTGLARAGGGEVPTGLSVAMVGAASAIHATRVTACIADGSIGTVTFAPASLPLGEIAQRLSAARPHLLAGYAGALRLVAEEQLAGRLDIRPAMVVSTSEQLTCESAKVLSDAFGVPPTNAFGSSEGLNGFAAPGQDTFTFASDATYVEFVDEHDHPVPIGTTAHHVLITNLLNTTQPLIRYRLGDAMTQRPPSAGSGHQRATVEGRSDEVIRLGQRRVHPIVVRSVLVRCSAVAEYQVRTTDRSMHVAVIATGPVDTDHIATELRRGLATAGVDTIDVIVERVEHLARDPRTGKLVRFVTG